MERVGPQLSLGPPGQNSGISNTMHTRGFDFDFGAQERKGATVLTGEIFRKWISELWRCSEEGSGAVLCYLLFTASVLQGTYKQQYLGLGQR